MLILEAQLTRFQDHYRSLLSDVAFMCFRHYNISARPSKYKTHELNFAIVDIWNFRLWMIMLKCSQYLDWGALSNTLYISPVTVAKVWMEPLKNDFWTPHNAFVLN
jgi:hypothetical protein